MCDIEEDSVGGGVEVCKARERKTGRDGGARVKGDAELVPDIRYREGYVAPEGKFIEKLHQKHGHRRGPGVCECCRGVYCVGLHQLVGGLMDSGELPPDCKVSDSVGGICV